MKITILAIFLIGAVVWSFVPKFTEVKVTDDGTFLFYNSPAALRIDKDVLVISYLTSEGDVVLDVWKGDERLSKSIVHSYKDSIDYKLGMADDHAAPAIIFDDKTSEVILATAYHGSEMYLYRIDINKWVSKLSSTWIGAYTYPRFVSGGDKIYLLARRQNDTDLAGHLIYRKSIDNFVEEKKILESAGGEVIYAGKPVFYDKSIHFVYSTHRYEESRLLGLNYIQYDVVKQKVRFDCNLSNLIGDGYFSNRPTGIAVLNDAVIFGTAFFDPPVTYSKAEEENFSQLQSVLILKGYPHDCDSFGVMLRKKNVAMPYYDADVAFNSHGEYIIFDNSKIHSNWSLFIKNCFSQERMLYPSFIDDNTVVYAVMNKSYRIRDFSNSIYLCQKK